MKWGGARSGSGGLCQTGAGASPTALGTGRCGGWTSPKPLGTVGAGPSNPLMTSASRPRRRFSSSSTSSASGWRGSWASQSVDFWCTYHRSNPGNLTPSMWLCLPLQQTHTGIRGGGVPVGSGPTLGYQHRPPRACQAVAVQRGATVSARGGPKKERPIALARVRSGFTTEAWTDPVREAAMASQSHHLPPQALVSSRVWLTAPGGGQKSPLGGAAGSQEAGARAGATALSG